VETDKPEAGLGRILADFVAQFWERQVVRLTGATIVPFVSEADLFSVLVAAADHNETEQVASDYVVWISGKLQPQPRNYSALASDESLHGYLTRLSRMVGEEEFTVLLPNPHRLSSALRKRVTSFVQMLAVHSGIPCGGFDSGIFLGRYGRTPFGVHRGQMSVLTFPIVGSKRFLLWPSSYGEIHCDIQDSVDYEAHRQAATVLIVEPGDIGYWPADYWHIADAPVTYSAALNIGLWWDQPPLDVVLRSFSEVLAEHHHEIEAERVCIDGALVLSNGLAPSFEEALDLVAKIARSTETRVEIQLRCLALRSTYGMRDFYTRRTLGNVATQPVLAKLKDSEKIFVEALSDGSLGVALLGRAVAIPASPKIVSQIEQLNSGGLLELDLSTVQDGNEQLADASSRLTRLLVESLAVELDTGHEARASK
jgi:hypothetical protein